MPMKMKKPKKSLKIATPKKRPKSAPPAQQEYKELGSLRSMMQKMDAKLSAYPKGGFAAKGEQMGSRFGTLGALAGRGLGAGLSAITGYGNYAVKKNTLSKVSSSVDMVPQFVKNEHSIRVTHREYISDINVPSAPTAYNMIYAQKINPGNSAMFPWLAKMAKQYSQYKIHGMVFTFKTMTSEYSQNGPLGTVMMATNYDAVERVYTSKVELENSEFAVSCKPSESLIHAIECDPKYTTLEMLYIRDSSYDSGDTSDRRFYDFGTFQLATTGLPGLVGSTMGEFWVSYDIELCKPIVGGTTDAQVIAANTIVSTPSGLLAVSPDARPLNIQWTGAAFNPTASQVVVMTPDPASLITFTGDVAAIGKIYSLESNTALKLWASGKYIITYSISASASPSNFRMAIENTTTTSCKPTFSSAGTAGVISATTVFEQTLSDDQIGFVPDNSGAVTGTRCTYTGVITVNVAGIPINDTSGSNFVLVTSPTYVANPLARIQAVVRRVDIEYVAFGRNTQTPAFTLL